jgi:hypothetical protein
MRWESLLKLRMVPHQLTRFRTGTHRSRWYRGRRPYGPRDREKRADTLFAKRTNTVGHKRGVPAAVRWPID